jgi:hypothetical protein
MPSNKPICFVLAGLAVGAFLTYLYSSNHNLRGRIKDGHPFFLGVAATFKSLEDKEEFIKAFTPLASYVKNKEFSTLSYEVIK